jgi:hypothetical protein
VAVSLLDRSLLLQLGISSENMAGGRWGAGAGGGGGSGGGDAGETGLLEGCGNVPKGGRGGGGGGLG